MSEAKKPARQFRIGNVKASIWANQNFFNVELTKSYKKGDQWEDTSSLGHADLLNAAAILKRCEAWIAEQ